MSLDAAPSAVRCGRPRTEVAGGKDIAKTAKCTLLFVQHVAGILKSPSNQEATGRYTAENVFSLHAKVK